MKGTKYLNEIQNVITYSGEISGSLFREIYQAPFTNIRDHHHTKNSRIGVVKLLVFLKLLNIETVNKIIQSDFKNLISFGKDVFYSLKNNSNLDWRSCLSSQAFACYNKLDSSDKINSEHETPCFIIDDSDIPKRGKKTELIGKVYSHNEKKMILGCKSLNLSLWTGKNLFQIDFSLHGEMGKKKNQCISKKQRTNRFSKTRDSKCKGQIRIGEYFKKKTTMAISMVKRSIKKGFKAPYLLADSWFFNKDLIGMCIKENIDLISRPKRNNWKYFIGEKAFTLKNLTTRHRTLKLRKWWKEMNMHYFEMKVKFQGHDIKLYFFKENKRGTKWHVIATTALKLNAKRAYKIYQNRWSIEVGYKELKQYLNYGKCQSLDFDAQISDATQCLMCYNFLSLIKAKRDYETIGGIFMEVSKKWISPTTMQKFWNEVMKLLKQIARIVDVPVQKLRDCLLLKSEFYLNFINFRKAFTAET